ncbi:hypothetical protein V7x_48600 [Crateriforma conspicua]|uniref:Uncharacterized protein n=1 Tax=Crateriforma conspicua TaxID=2527996 RepID=A0A5C6FPG2_9PLAN|nr:hypothetical protein V7x_48600 [Crateriforma conspicua]
MRGITEAKFFKILLAASLQSADSRMPTPVTGGAPQANELPNVC